MGKEIYRELCKKLKFDHSTELNMRKPESVKENETHELIWDFEFQMDHHIPARRQDQVDLWDFAVSMDHRLNIKEIEIRNKYLDFARDLS